MIPELQALTQRLEDVERQVAHLEALAVEHSDTDRTEAARTVNAQRFVVTDEHGVRRAELGMSIPAGETEEQPWLGLFDADGNVRACLGVHDGQPWLEFYDASQSSPLQIRIDEHGPQISLFYGNAKAAAVIALPIAGPQMSLFGADGQESVRLSASGDGPQFTLTDANGKVRASVSLWEGEPSVSLNDASGKGEVSLRATSSGAKELFMGEYGSQAQPTVGPSLKLAVTTDGPHMLFGKDNSVFWSAP